MSSNTLFALVLAAIVVFSANPLTAQCAESLEADGFSAELLHEQHIPIPLVVPRIMMGFIMLDVVDIGYDVGYYRVNGDEIWMVDCATMTVIG